MKRKTFDLLLTAGGGAVLVLLIVAGILLSWGASFANSNVHNQLAEQQIYFPTAAEINSAPASSTEIPPSIKPFLLKYAGQEVLTGPQAQTYADHFISEHLSEMPYGGVYSKVSAAALAAPKGSAEATQLSGLETTVFQGTTLRGLLLEAYGFSVFAQIATYGAVACFILAGVMAILTILGLLHFSRVTDETQFPRSDDRQEVLASA